MRSAAITRRRRGQNDRGRGFTLIELLVVMFIMAIIVALIVGVGRYVTDSAAKKETQAAQAIVMRAIEAYREEDPNGQYPDADDTKELVEQLSDSEKAWAIMGELSGGLISGSDATILDGYGETMKYDDDGGFGGRPVLISAGPDRRFGSEGSEYGHDDIRSDR